MILSKEIAQKILNVLKDNSDEDHQYDAFKKEFDNDPIWYVLALASYWYNDLQGWCEAIIADDLHNFFCSEDDILNKELIPASGRPEAKQAQGRVLNSPLLNS